jgi:transposase InsO family protein
LAQREVEASRSKVRRAMKKGGLLKCLPGVRRIRQDSSLRPWQPVYQFGFPECAGPVGAIQSMSVMSRCCDNVRIKSLFATLKKEKLYQIRTEKMLRAQVNSIVFGYIMTYYNREQIYTGNPGNFAPAVYRKTARGLDT